MTLGGTASAALGAFLLLAVFVDVVKTALGARGAGPLFTALAANFWRAGLWVHHLRPNHRLLAGWGIAILLSTFLLWGMLLWAGCVLVFGAAPDSVVASQTGLPANWIERVYYVGFSISTLGIGDYVANGSIWQVLTVAAATSGFFVLTLGVTYLLSVLPAVARKRALAHYISALGRTPGEFLTNQWRDGNCEELLRHGSTLMELTETLAQEHAAFPVLHYFHATERNGALPLRLAVVSEALLYLESGAVSCPATTFGLRPLRRSLDSMLATLGELYLVPSGDVPPLPRLDRLPPAIAVDTGADLAAAAARWERQRRTLLRYVSNEGWSWDDVYRHDAGDSEAERSGAI